MKALNPEGRWPDLFDGPDDEARHEVRQIVAANWHEGWIPNRAEVAEIIGIIRGDTTASDQLRS